ncbi:MAG TPA: hypothetical protein DIU37_00790, partial [Opitutae bacterium]|nr:hypothetical protein [Opitutae bacterium]
DATAGTIGIFVDDNNGTPASAITHTIHSAITLGTNAILENDAASSNVNIELAGAVSLGSNRLTVQGAQDSEISGIISGTGGKLSKDGTGTLILSGANTYTGDTKVGDGIVEVQNLSALGTSAGDTTIESGATVAFNLPASGTVNENFEIEGTGTAGQGALVNSGTQSVFISGTIEFKGDAMINAQTAFILLDGNIILGADTVTLNADSGSMRTGSSTVISGTGGLIKTGTGFVSYGNSSTTHNTYTGLTDVVGGTLSTSTASDNATIIPGNIKVQSGATLALLHNNNVADTSDVELNGGTLRFQTGGAGSNTIAETLDTLTLTDDSSLVFSNLGSSVDGALVVSFSDSSGTSWTSGKKLIIEDWDGSFSGGGRNQLFFGSNSSGLSTGQLAQVTFLNPNGLGGFWDAKLLSTGELVPVPEPSTWIFGSLALVILAYVERRRLWMLWTYLSGRVSR